MRTRGLGLVLLALAASLSACGGDDGDSNLSDGDRLACERLATVQTRLAEVPDQGADPETVGVLRVVQGQELQAAAVSATGELRADLEAAAEALMRASSDSSARDFEAFNVIAKRAAARC